MQFLAFLKDSFREARNGWVLQAMLVLAFLLVLFVASISFTPTNVETSVSSPLGLMNWSFRNNPNLSGVKLEVQNYKESNPREPWNSDYDFDFVVNANSPDQLKLLDENRQLPVSRARVERFIGQAVDVLKNVKVEKRDPLSPSEVRFRVTSQGTKAKDVTEWPHLPKILFAFEAPLFITPLRNGVYFIENYIVSGAGAWVILFISVVITSGFIPNMLQKGTVDLAISKPITRPVLLIYKFIGGLIFTLLLTAFTIGGAYLAIGLRTNMWNHNFLLSIPLIVAYFSILYVVSTLTAVLTRSAIVAILFTLIAWGIFFGVGKVNKGVLNREVAVAAQVANPGEAMQAPKPGEDVDLDGIISRIDPDAPLWGFIPKSTFGIVKAVYFVCPRTYQLDERLDQLIAEGILPEEDKKLIKLEKTVASWGEILGISFGFIACVLGLACWRFASRDS